MKKVIAQILVLLMVFTYLSATAYAAEGIRVEFNGSPVIWTDAKPFVNSDGRTMVPLRAVADAMGVEVTWDADMGNAIFTCYGEAYQGQNPWTSLISFIVGSKTAEAITFTNWLDGDPDVNSWDIPMDTSPTIVNGRTYAPIRYMAEFFGCTVTWSNSTNTVSIWGDPSHTYPSLTNLPSEDQTGVVSLADLSHWNRSTFGIGPHSNQSITDNMGTEYNVSFTSDGGWCEYRIDRAYSTFDGRIIIENNYRSSTQLSYMRIYGDGQMLYGVSMTGGTKPKDFKIDISGVDILRIEINSATQGGGRAITHLVNAYLCKEGYSYSPIEIMPTIYPKGSTPLANLDWWNKSEFGIGPVNLSPIEDYDGNEYYEYFSGTGYQEYALNGNYSIFTGRLIFELGSLRN